MPSRVIGSTMPPASPRSSQPRAGRRFTIQRPGRQRRNRPAVFREPQPRRHVPFEPPGDDPKQRRRPALVSLRTGADGEMIGPRERPQVSGGLVFEGNGDRRRCAAVHVESRRNATGPRGRTVPRRVRRTRLLGPSAPSSQSTRTVSRLDSSVHPSEPLDNVPDTRAHQAGARTNCRVEQRLVEDAPRHDREQRLRTGRRRRRSSRRRSRRVRTSRPSMPTAGRAAGSIASRTRSSARPGDATPAGLLPRMAAVEHHDPGSTARKTPGGASAGGAAADDPDVVAQRAVHAFTVQS